MTNDKQPDVREFEQLCRDLWIEKPSRDYDLAEVVWLEATEAALQSPPQPPQREQSGEAVAKGYALLGSGQYILNHTLDFHPELGAELLITLATDEEKATRTVGDLADNPVPAPMIYPQDMVIRIGFINERGLFALEQQLKLLREAHFPSPESQAAHQPLQEGEKEASLVLMLRNHLPYRDESGVIGFALHDYGRILRAANLLERDLELEKEACSRLCAELNRTNGPTIMGEPVLPHKHCNKCGLGKAEWAACDAADCGELVQAPQPVAQDDSELVGLRKDAERWRYWRTQRNVNLITAIFGNGCINRTVEMAEAEVDASIAASHIAKKAMGEG
jgi:hypothetical protein